jgi:predicted dehydrogenase
MLENRAFSIWIFGAGYWANVLIPKIILKFTNIKIYIVDEVQENATRLKEIYEEVEISSKMHFDEVAKVGDVCFVLTPPESHASVIANVLRKQCHCWVEKPFTIDPNMAVNLQKLAKLNKCVLFVDHTFTFDPLIRKIKDKCQDLKIQNIISIRHGWGKVLEKYGVLWDLLPHDLSIINFVFGEIVRAEVISEIKIDINGIKTSVYAEIKIETEMQKNILVSVSCISKTKLREIQIFSEPNLLTYSLIPSGSILEILNYTNIPGASKNHLDHESDLKIKNDSDSLLNALNLFENYVNSSNFDSNLDYATREVEIIFQLVENSIYKKSS